MDGNDFEDISATKASDIWKHWLFRESTGEAKCIVCKAILKAPLLQAKGLKQHSLKQHQIVVEKVVRAALPLPKKAKIDNFFLPKKMSIETKVSRLCALTRLSFKTLANDVDIRASLKAEGYDLPRGNSGIQKLVYKKYGKL